MAEGRGRKGQRKEVNLDDVITEQDGLLITEDTEEGDALLEQEAVVQPEVNVDVGGTTITLISEATGEMTPAKKERYAQKRARN